MPVAWNFVPVPVVPVNVTDPGVPPVPPAAMVGVPTTFVLVMVATGAAVVVPPPSVIVLPGA